MKALGIVFLLLVSALDLRAQQTLRWSATTGDVVLSGTATAATIQQPATNASPAYIDQVVVYCTVACNITLTANATAATTTAGSFKVLIPTQLGLTVPANFFTASNYSNGTTQGGLLHVPAGATVTLCFSQSCGNPAQVYLGTGNGTADNFTVSTAAITGTINITFYGRSIL